MMDQMDKALDHNVILEAKNKLSEALSQVKNTTNEEQREKVKSILESNPMKRYFEDDILGSFNGEWFNFFFDLGESISLNEKKNVKYIMH